MIQTEKLSNIKDIIQEYVGPKKTLIDVKLSRLNPPGENYLSLMVKIDAVLKDCDNSTEETFHAVAKCISEYEFSKIGFTYTFESELIFYTVIIPTLQTFLKENGKEELDIFPKYIGARPKSHDGSVLIDEHSVLVLENLKAEGYCNVDRFIGFDFETAKLILADLASFHAVPLALKFKKPDVFEEKIRKYCEVKMPPPPSDLFMNIISVVCQVLEDYPTCKEWVPKLKTMMEFSSQHLFEKQHSDSSEPFGTISHYDMWVNNTMQQFQDGQPVKNKFVDFQMCVYESPVQDLIFFLLSSVRLSVLKDHFEDFIELYHKLFIQNLKEFQCDTAAFERRYFFNDIEKLAYGELIHVLFMTFVIFGKKGTVLKQGEIPGVNNKKEDLSPEVKDKMAFIVELCAQKGWIV